jgi:integrase
MRGIYEREKGSEVWWIRYSDSTDRIRLYDLRHTFGTMAAREGMPLGVLQDMLGHADPAMTRRYTQKNDLAAQRAFFSRQAAPGPTITKLPIP